MASIARYTPTSLAEFYTETTIKNAPKHTGRLPTSDKEEKMTFPPARLFAPEPSMEPASMSEKTYIHMSETPTNAKFFSRENMDKLHADILKAVYDAKGYVIDRQSEIDLKLVMRSYYQTYSKNDPDNVAAEVAELNQRVVQFASNRILVEIEAYKHYRADILDFPEPIAHPVQTNIYGTRTGELNRFF